MFGDFLVLIFSIFLLLFIFIFCEDTSAVTDMSCLFYMNQLTTNAAFNGGNLAWDISNVVNFDAMSPAGFVCFISIVEILKSHFFVGNFLGFIKPQSWTW